MVRWVESHLCNLPLPQFAKFAAFLVSLSSVGGKGVEICGQSRKIRRLFHSDIQLSP
jgi:hypothetical protein